MTEPSAPLPDQGACPSCGSTQTPEELPPSDYVKCPTCTLVHAREWRTCPRGAVQEHRDAMAERDRLRAENERWRKIIDELDAYVGHHDVCVLRSGAPECSCGFDEMYTQVRAFVRGASDDSHRTNESR